MQSRIRDLRRSMGLTLADVAARCDPPTTAVTIGRLEVGARTLTVPWINRISAALGVPPAELVTAPDSPDIAVAAILTGDGIEAPTKPLTLNRPVPAEKAVGVVVEASVGDYRSGDQLWLEQLPPERFAQAVNADILAPRTAGRFTFGRLVAVDGARLQVQPPRPGARQVVVNDAPWLGVVRMLIRRL